MKENEDILTVLIKESQKHKMMGEESLNSSPIIQSKKIIDETVPVRLEDIKKASSQIKPKKDDDDRNKVIVLL